MIFYDLRQNKNKDSKAFNKWFAYPVIKETVDLDDLASHMSNHNTVFSKGVILGMLTDMVGCIKELILLGQPVKLDNLAIFKASVVSTPADDVESFELDSNVKSLKLLAIATGRLTRKMLTQDALLGYTSLAERVRKGEIALSNKKGEYIATEDTGNDPVVNP
jgi:hypothetical protein